MEPYNRENCSEHKVEPEITAMDVRLISNLVALFLTPRCASGFQKKVLRKRDQHDFWPRSQAQWRTPGAGSVRGINLQSAELLKAMIELAPDSLRDHRPGKDLPAMGVAGKLERYAFFFANGQAHRRMQQQNAGTFAIELHAA